MKMKMKMKMKIGTARMFGGAARMFGNRKGCPVPCPVSVDLVRSCSVTVFGMSGRVFGYCASMSGMSVDLVRCMFVRCPPRVRSLRTRGNPLRKKRRPQRMSGPMRRRLHPVKRAGNLSGIRRVELHGPEAPATSADTGSATSVQVSVRVAVQVSVCASSCSWCCSSRPAKRRLRSTLWDTPERVAQVSARSSAAWRKTVRTYPAFPLVDQAFRGVPSDTTATGEVSEMWSRNRSRTRSHRQSRTGRHFGRWTRPTCDQNSRLDLHRCRKHVTADVTTKLTATGRATGRESGRDRRRWRDRIGDRSGTRQEP